MKKLERIQERTKHLSTNQQFSFNNIEKVLLLDSDFHIYRAASTVKKLETAIRRYYKLVFEAMFYVGVNKAIAFITPSGCSKCNRYLYPSVKEYQANRSGAIHIPLKEPLKEYIMNNPNEYLEQGIQVMYDRYFEADDLIMINSYSLKDNGIVYSGDKDLRLTPYAWFDDEYGKVSLIDEPLGFIEYNNTNAAPLKGRGTKFFLAQLIMGDTADHVTGLKKYKGKPCGPEKAFRVLNDITDESEAVEEVVKLYAKINQNVLAEAEMLWLRRNNNDNAYTYLMEHVANQKLRDWITSLHEYHLEYVQDQLETNE